MNIESNFESGNIVVQNLSDTTASLTIRPDSNAQFYQWFYFRVSGQSNILRTFTITNAGGSSYPRAWPGYRALASYDEKSWFRVQTIYDGANLILRHQAAEQTTFYAFFVPYTEAMRTRLISDCEKSPAAIRREVVKTPQGRSVDLIVIGPQQPAKKIWIISRQHAGEPMAEYCIEGMIRRLLDKNDAVTAALLNKNIAFYLVPNVNPDGSALGNLRSNSLGADLNRAWLNPTANAPEVAALRQLMESEGVDFFIDLHGDEDRPFIWVVQPHPANVIPAMQSPQQRFEDEVSRRHAEYGPLPQSMAAVNADSGMSLDYVAAHFKCPAFIIELPFKDTVGARGEADSLLAEGCIAFGRSCLDIINDML
jgi:murein tripeptide amidase MpaA